MRKLSTLITESFSSINEATDNNFLIELQSKLIKALTKEFKKASDKLDNPHPARRIEKAVHYVLYNIATGLQYNVNDTDTIVGNIDIKMVVGNNTNQLDISFVISDGDNKYKVEFNCDDSNHDFVFSVIPNLPNELRKGKNARLNVTAIDAINRKYRQI